MEHGKGTQGDARMGSESVMARIWWFFRRKLRIAWFALMIYIAMC